MLNEAITCYTRAIEHDPYNAVYPANRAMCLLKQEKYGAADVDCTLSITLDPRYAKAFHRRATARAKLGRLEEARKDYEQLLKLEPNSKLAQMELNKLEQSIEMRQLVFPIVKTETQRSKKPLRRIDIEEINDESADKMELAKNMDEINQRVKLNEKDEKLFESNASRRIQVIEEIGTLETSVDNVKLGEAETKREVELKKEIVESSPSLARPAVGGGPKKIPDAPVNGYQFKKDWQFLSASLEDLATYFKVDNHVLILGKVKIWFNSINRIPYRNPLYWDVYIKT